MAVSAGMKTCDMGEQLGKVTLTMRVKYRNVTRFRMWLAMKLLRLVKYTAPMQIRIVETTEEEV